MSSTWTSVSAASWRIPALLSRDDLRRSSVLSVERCTDCWAKNISHFWSAARLLEGTFFLGETSVFAQREFREGGRHLARKWLTWNGGCCNLLEAWSSPCDTDESAVLTSVLRDECSTAELSRRNSNKQLAAWWFPCLLVCSLIS